MTPVLDHHTWRLASWASLRLHGSRIGQVVACSWRLALGSSDLFLAPRRLPSGSTVVSDGIQGINNVRGSLPRLFLSSPGSTPLKLVDWFSSRRFHSPPFAFHTAFGAVPGCWESGRLQQWCWGLPLVPAFRASKHTAPAPVPQTEEPQSGTSARRDTCSTQQVNPLGPRDPFMCCIFPLRHQWIS